MTEIEGIRWMGSPKRTWWDYARKDEVSACPIRMLRTMMNGTTG